MKASVKGPHGIMQWGYGKPKGEKTWVWILAFWCAYSRIPLVLGERVILKQSTSCCLCIWELFSTLKTKGQIRRKGCPGWDLEWRNRGAGRRDEVGSAPCSPASCLSKLIGHVKDVSKLSFLTYCVEKSSFYPILKSLFSFFLFFFFCIQEDSVVTNCQEKKLWWVTERKFSRNDNTSQKWKLLHLLYMGTVKSPLLLHLELNRKGLTFPH